MKYIKYNEERLRKFANHLKKGEVKCNEVYDKLTHLHSDKKVVDDDNLVPIFFLPIMELPYIFPIDWYYDENFLPVYKFNKDKETISSVLEYLGLNKWIFIHLFVKGKQRTEVWGGNELSVNPTFKDIGYNVEDLLEHLEYYSNIKGNDFQIYLN